MSKNLIVAMTTVALASCAMAETASAQDIPSGMIASFAMSPDKPNKCPRGWTKFEQASGKFVVGAAWKGDMAVYAAPQDGNLNQVTVRSENLPTMSVDFGNSLRGIPAYEGPPLFSAASVMLYGRPADSSSSGNGMRDSDIKATVGGSGKAIDPISPPSFTMMMCRKM